LTTSQNGERVIVSGPESAAGSAAIEIAAADGSNKPRREQQKKHTSVSLSEQGLVLVLVLEAAVTGLEPGKHYVLALASEATGGGAPLQGFMTNPAGAAVVNAIGPIRQLVRGEDKCPRRYLVIAPGTAEQHGAPVQVQAE